MVANAESAHTEGSGGLCGEAGYEGALLAQEKGFLPVRLGLRISPHLAYETWTRVGRHLTLIADASPWWLGDWLNFGAKRYPGRYELAARTTCLEYGTLRNYASVARRYSMSRRRDGLSFQHHAEVAPLLKTEQDMWLDRAERFRWSRNDFRRNIRVAAATSAQQADTGPVTLQLRLNSDQERIWSQAAAKVDCSLQQWAAIILDDAADAVVHERRGTAKIA